MPRRRSVKPAASQMRVISGRPITRPCPSSAEPDAVALRRWRRAIAASCPSCQFRCTMVSSSSRLWAAWQGNALPAAPPPQCAHRQQYRLVRMRRSQLARTILAAPGEQHVGIDPMLPGKHGHRNTGCAGRRQPALEFRRVVRPPRSIGYPACL